MSIESMQKRGSTLVVLHRLRQFVIHSPENIDIIAGAIDDMLDDLKDMSTFGEDGELDPRGDMRKGNWELSEINIGENVDIRDE